MLNKLKVFVGSHKKLLLVGALIVIVLIGGLAIKHKHEADKRKQEAARHNSADRDVAKDPKPIIYTLTSAQVSCKDVPPTPNAKTTINVCSGKATLSDNKTKTSTTYTVSQNTHLYKASQEVSPQEFVNIPANKQLAQVSFTGKDKKTLSSVVYFP